MAQSSERSFWLDRSILVTGCTGLLGSHLADLLITAKANVIALVRDSVPRSRLVEEGLLGKLTAVRGDVTDFALLQRALNEYEVETVFHLAAQTIVGTANRSPLSTFEANVAGTWRLLEACRLSPTVKAVVVASSDKAYGDQEELPYNETTPLEGRHPYDVSKSCADLIALAYHKTYGLPVCVTRCGNFYGPGDLNWNRIVPGTIRSLLRKESPLIRSNGTPVRDYLYVKDGALAYRLVAEKMLAEGLTGEAFNFSNENPVSVLDMAQRIVDLMGCQHLKPKTLDIAPNEIQNQYLSSEKARRILKWKPQYSQDQGLQETIAWYRRLLAE